MNFLHQIRLGDMPENMAMPLLAGVAFVAIFLFLQSRTRPYPGIPVVTMGDEAPGGKSDPASDWFHRCRELVSKGLREQPSAFQISNGRGYWIVLPSVFMDELRNHPDMSLRNALREENFPNYPGFDGFRTAFNDSTFTQEVIRVKITQSLGLVTANLAAEAIAAVHEYLGEDWDWTEHAINEEILDIVAQLTSRVFLGTGLCRNKEWLRITKEYARNSFMGAEELRRCSALTRPFMQWFLPACTQLRTFAKAARRLINPEVQKRRLQAESAMKSGKKPPKTEDTIGWMVEVARGRKVDYVGGQLALSLAAIHSTTDNTAKAILQLCEMPEIVEPLRKEIIDVLQSTGGWSKIALYKMRLMDSFLKEVQRTAPFTPVGMHRRVMKAYTLSDGTYLPANSRLMVICDKLKDPKTYDEPEKFKYDRFARLREQAGEEDHHQLASTSNEFATFGHGQHACPGRFFASAQLKIALACMLLKYDFRFVPGQTSKPQNIQFEMVQTIDPTVKIQLRRRKETLEFGKISTDNVDDLSAAPLNPVTKKD